MKKVTVVTGGRADWGLLSPVCKVLADSPAFELHVVATGQHTMATSGQSLDKIRQDGFVVGSVIDLGLTKDDSPKAVTMALGKAIQGMAEELAANRPDLLLVLGDRYEILGAVQAALLAKVPVAHICGGDVTEGALDDSMRHAITKMAHIHFVTNEVAAQRVIQMGENPAFVCCAGNPGLDHIHTMTRMDKEAFFESIAFTPRAKNILFTFHPVTVEQDSEAQCRSVLDALGQLGADVGIIVTGSNADAEGGKLNTILQDFADGRDHICFYQSLGTERYFNALCHVDAVVGNSSSGLYEAPSFGLPAVNIGDRQKGRLKATCVIDCVPEQKAVLRAVQKALSQERGQGESPYGDGHSAARIVEFLSNVDDFSALCRKTFYDVKVK